MFILQHLKLDHSGVEFRPDARALPWLQNRRSSTYSRSQGRHDQTAPVLLQSSGRTLSGRSLDVASSSTGQATLGAAGNGNRTAEDGQEHQATDNRQEVPPMKGWMETLEAIYPKRGAGIPGPWEPVLPPKEVRVPANWFFSRHVLCVGCAAVTLFLMRRRLYRLLE